MFIRTTSLIVAATLAAATVSFPAFAATDKAPEISVDYADLDLSTKAGQNALRSRVSKAAGEVCRKMSRSGHGDPCRSNLTRRTLAAITVPANTAIAAR